MPYSIAETAKKFDINPHTIRYYEKEGLLPFVKRSASGIRYFTDSDYEALKIIMCLKNTGMQIKDIKHFIDLCEQGDSTFEQRLELFKRQKETVEARIAELQQNLATLKFKEQFYTEKLKERN